MSEADDSRVIELESVLQHLVESIRIDKFQLDDEWVKQPQLMQDACDAYATALSYRDQSKSVLEQADANIARRIRTTPKPENDKTKITENGVIEMVLADPEHVERAELHLKYKHLTDRCKGMLDTLQQRADALKDLVRLYNAKYYGTLVPNDPEYQEAHNAMIVARHKKNAEKETDQNS